MNLLLLLLLLLVGTIHGKEQIFSLPDKKIQSVSIFEHTTIESGNELQKNYAKMRDLVSQVRLEEKRFTIRKSQYKKSLKIRMLLLQILFTSLIVGLFILVHKFL